MLTIEVQPPSQVQVDAFLYPPLVVSAESDDAYEFIQIALIDPYGRVHEDQLCGTLSASGRGLNDKQASGSRKKEYFTFPDLKISHAGTYALRINAIRMDYKSPDEIAAVTAASTVTTQIIAQDQSVAAKIPSPDEQNLLRRLKRNGGFRIPRAPR